MAAAPVDRKQERKGPPGIDQVTVSYRDMRAELEESAINLAKAALAAFYNGEKRFLYEVAETLKKEMDKAHGGTWHVIVGREFGSHVSYEAAKCVPKVPRSPTAAAVASRCRSLCAAQDAVLLFGLDWIPCVPAWLSCADPAP